MRQENAIKWLTLSARGPYVDGPRTERIREK